MYDVNAFSLSSSSQSSNILKYSIFIYFFVATIGFILHVIILYLNPMKDNEKETFLKCMDLGFGRGKDLDLACKKLVQECPNGLKKKTDLYTCMM
jgi:hypothetical protein